MVIYEGPLIVLLYHYYRAGGPPEMYLPRPSGFWFTLATRRWRSEWPNRESLSSPSLACNGRNAGCEKGCRSPHSSLRRDGSFQKEGDPSIDPKGTFTKLWEALISLNQYIPLPKTYIILLESVYNPYIPLFNPISLEQDFLLGRRPPVFRV